MRQFLFVLTYVLVLFFVDRFVTCCSYTFQDESSDRSVKMQNEDPDLVVLGNGLFMHSVSQQAENAAARRHQMWHPCRLDSDLGAVRCGYTSDGIGVETLDDPILR